MADRRQSSSSSSSILRVVTRISFPSSSCVELWRAAPAAIQQNACCRRTRGRWRGLLPDPVKHRKSADIFFPRSAAAAGGRQSDWPNVSFQAETLIDKPRSWSPSGSPCRTIVPTLGERDSSYKDLAPFPPRRRSRIALICGSGTPAETPQADMAIALALLHGTATNAEG